MLGLAALTAAPLATHAATIEEIAARSNAAAKADQIKAAEKAEEPVTDNKDSLNLYAEARMLHSTVAIVPVQT